MNTIGNRIKLTRKNKFPKMTQQQLAKKVGVSREAVSQWESGDSKTLKHENLMAVSIALECDLKWLMTGTKFDNTDAVKTNNQINESAINYSSSRELAIKLINEMSQSALELALPYLEFLKNNR